MSKTHPGNPTNPLRRGAPLPDQGIFTNPQAGTVSQDMLIGLPTLNPQDIQDELTRAGVELVYALARHRKAWQAMARRLDERAALVDVPGGLAAIDSDPIWKNRTHDVAWWRDEVTCQSTAILALQALIPAQASRSSLPDGTPISVLGWFLDGSQGAPTERQYRTACSWRDQVEHDGRPRPVAEINAIQDLIDAYEDVHPQPSARGASNGRS